MYQKDSLRSSGCTCLGSRLLGGMSVFSSNGAKSGRSLIAQSGSDKHPCGEALRTMTRCHTLATDGERFDTMTI